jgi:hypothetical protein
MKMTAGRTGIAALLALAVAGITAASTRMTDVAITNSTVSSSTINSTPVGATTASTGRLRGLPVCEREGFRHGRL